MQARVAGRVDGLKLKAIVSALGLVVLLQGLASTASAQETGVNSQRWWQTLQGRATEYRDKLKATGIEVELDYAAEMFSNVSGGRAQETRFLDNVDALLTLDLGALFGWRGGTAFLYGLGNNGGNPSEIVGDVQGVSNIEAIDSWKLYEAWIEQTVADEKVALLLGLFDLNSELDVIPSASLFSHSSHGIGPEFGLSGRNGPSIFPVTSLGARLRVEPFESYYVRAVVADGVAGDPDDPLGTHIVLNRADGLLLAVEAGMLVQPRQEVKFRPTARHAEQPAAVADAEPREGHFGKVAVGVWGFTTKLDDLSALDSAGRPVSRDGTAGAYLLAERRIYMERDKPTQGLTVYGRVGFADARTNFFDTYLGQGLVYRGLLPGRNRDVAGLGLAAAHAGSHFTTRLEREGVATSSWEVALELTYRLRILPWLSLRPAMQYVKNPGLDRTVDDAVSFSGRVFVSIK